MVKRVLIIKESFLIPTVEDLANHVEWYDGLLLRSMDSCHFLFVAEISS